MEKSHRQFSRVLVGCCRAACVSAHAFRPTAAPWTSRSPCLKYLPYNTYIDAKCRVNFDQAEGGTAMSVLEDILEEEYERSARLIRLMEEEIASLPKGSVRTRRIGSRDYYYLNYREGDKVRSDYIQMSAVEEVRGKIARRKELQAALKEQRTSQRQIERALGRRLRNE